MSDCMYRPHNLLYMIVVLIALYMSFKRNNGFDLGSFLVAFFFSPIYIAYYLAMEPAALKL